MALKFFRDLFRPAEKAAKAPPRDVDYDPHLGYGWHRSDEPAGTRPIRFRMTADDILRPKPSRGPSGGAR